ncbi:MAG: 4Fe-4S dicluster domain-containing protein [Deltaproteobacteria bacterium]|jgi:Fe-S oxidoreductase|nr:4Fe-4S dicluster domain-containing protein [Deltaproteobacteria bacterium]
MDKAVLLALEDRCTYEEPPACQSFCPLHVDARAIAQRLGEGKAGEARKALDRQMPLPQLTGWLCEGACQERCPRQGLDAGVNLPLLERFTLRNSKTIKPFPLPATAHKTAAIGSSLATLCLASDLSRKGHKVTIFLTGPKGGSLLTAGERLPTGVLTEAFELIDFLGNAWEEAPAQTPEFLARLLTDYAAVFLDLGDPSVDPPALGLQATELALDPLTSGSSRERIFLAPPATVPYPFLAAASAGKKAAGSLDRLFQGVQPQVAREREAVFETTLVVDVSEAQPAPPVRPADPLSPTEAEIKAEAARCLNCSCRSCLSVCPHLRHYKGYPKKYAREMYNNIITAYGIRTSNILINSCLECDLCKEVCPNQADVAEFIRKARKEMIDTNHMPAAAHEYALEDLLSANGPDCGFFRPPPGEEKVSRVFFPGCQLVAGNPTAALKTYEFLNQTLGEVGLMSGCCGAPARWSGRSALTGSVTTELKKTWESAERPTFILACPSCQLFFQAELPEIPFVSLWEVLAQNPPPALIQSLELTLHDPCATRYNEKVQTSARRLLKTFAPGFKEQKFSGRLTKCCGYGGLGAQANESLGLEFTLDTAAAATSPLVSYCAMCRDRFAKAGFASLHLLEILFPTGNLQELAQRPAPNLTQRRDNRRHFRQLALTSVWRETLPEPARFPHELVISEELWAKMEKRRILRDDLELVIAEAAKNGPLFFNQKTGRSLAALRPRQVTFWVEYFQDPQGRYLIHDVWCHRMLAMGSPGEGAESPATLEGFARTGGRV